MGIGVFVIIASVANLDFFFNHRKSKLFLKLFGRQGARIFYTIFGLAIFTFGLLVNMRIIVIDN